MTAAHQWKRTPSEYRRILRGLYYRGFRADFEKWVREIKMETIQKCTAMLAVLVFGIVFAAFAFPPEPPSLSAPAMVAQRDKSDFDDFHRYVDAQDAAAKERISAAEVSIASQGRLLLEVNNRQIAMQTTMDLTLKIAAGLLALFSAYLVTKLNAIFGVFFKRE